MGNPARLTSPLRRVRRFVKGVLQRALHGVDGAQRTKRQLRPAVTWTDHARIRFRNPSPDDRIPKDKLSLRKIAEQVGVRVPKLLATFETAADIRFADLGDTFTIKPTNATNRVGVMLLHRLENSDLFLNAMDGKTRSERQIVDELCEIERQWKVKRRGNRNIGNFIAEERIFGTTTGEGIPLDYKLFVFGDEVPHLTQVDRNRGENAIYTYWFDCFAHTDYRGRILKATTSPGEPILPATSTRMIDVARAISAVLKTPFVRVDCYDTPDGVVLGEITYVPGGPYYGL